MNFLKNAVLNANSFEVVCVFIFNIFQYTENDWQLFPFPIQDMEYYVYMSGIFWVNLEIDEWNYLFQFFFRLAAWNLCKIYKVLIYARHNGFCKIFIQL